MKSVLIFMTAFSLVACGSSESGSADKPSDKTVPTPTVEVKTPVTYEWLDEKRWIAFSDTETIVTTLETGCEEWDPADYKICLKKGTERRFHLWLYDGKTTDWNASNKFFAVGSFSLSGDKICFDNIMYWMPPPEGFIFDSTEPFCADAKRDGDNLIIKVEKSKTLTLKFTSEPLAW